MLLIHSWVLLASLLSLQATTTCTVFSESGPLRANFTTQLPPISDCTSGRTFNIFLNLNATERTSIWLGAQFLNTYYMQLSTAMGWQPPYRDDTDWNSGLVYLAPNNETTDITSLRFFLVDAEFETFDGDLTFVHMPNTIEDWQPDQNHYGLPGIGNNIDALGKTIYSVILSDLGHNGSNNALTNERGVDYLGSRLDDNSTKVGGSDGTHIASVFGNGSYPSADAYESITQDLGHEPDLTLGPSTIFTQYSCSIPKRKDIGSLIVSILVADLVLLQVVWVLLNWLATLWLGRVDSEMNHCEACARADCKPGHESEYELVSGEAKSSHPVL